MRAKARSIRYSAHAALLLALAAGEAGAASCAGFIDVDDASAFCSSVQWMRNRTVTTGCAILNSYCPVDVVTRLSMAVFMNRLGTALVPVYVPAYNSGVNLDLNTSTLLCMTSNRSSPFPRTAHGVGVVGAGNAIGLGVDIAVEVVESNDGGASWNAVSARQAVTAAANTIRTVSVLLQPRLMTVDANYRWAIRVTRAAGLSTGTLATSWQCQLQIRLDNRNPDSAPFDPVD